MFKQALLAAALLAASASTFAFAGTPASAAGLGQSWPNATDISASPHWHVYRFWRDGVRYIQINDLNGTVHGAFAAAGDTILVLPVGTDAAQVSTAPATGSSSETVYKDDAVSVAATPQSDGTTAFHVTSLSKGNCPDVLHCTGTTSP